MASSLFRALGGMTSALALLAFTTVPARAENVVYNGDPTKLQNITNTGGHPDPVPNSVAPTGSEGGRSPSLANNTVTVTDGTGAERVYGAVNLGGNADAVSNNQVIIDGPSVNARVEGGWAPTVTGNSVTIKDGRTVTGYVYGGYSDMISGPATATNNRVTVGDGSIAWGYVYGGSAVVESGSAAATATGNSVDINGGKVYLGDVYGGYASAEAGNSTDNVPLPANGPVTASNNKVTISGISIVIGNVYGGYANHNDAGGTAANGNEVTVSGDTGAGIVGSVVGGYAESKSGAATASSNKVTISGLSIVDGGVTGGFAKSGGSATASSNTVTISDNATVYGDVIGGYVESVAGSATASNNTVTISDSGYVDWVYGGVATSASGTATASGNKVTIGDSGYVDGWAYGGYAESNSGTATASNNTVTISDDGMVGWGVSGGAAYSDSGAATTTNNTVTISGNGSVDGRVYGGEATSNSGTATATNNTVTISGNASVYGDVTGGYAYSDGAPGSATATNNTVTITGSPTFGSVVGLYGGYTYGAGAGDAFTGNTLNVWNYSGSAVDSVQNFQNYSFVFPTSQTGAVLTVNGTASLGNGTIGSTVTASTIASPGTAPLQQGTSVTLIDAGTPLQLNGFDPTQPATGQHGATVAYLWTLDTDNNQLTATLSQVKARPEAKTLSEGYLTGMALLNQSADLVAGSGMSAATNAAYLPDGSYGLGVFGAASGGWMRYDTGSHVEMSSISLMTGVAKHVQAQAGDLVIGAFFEYGNGSYDTYSAFHGTGDVSHLGGGIIGRMDFAGNDRGHLYTEASFRLGNVDNDYNSNGLRDLLGRTASYDSSSTYYGIHLAAGFIMNLTEDATLDLYGKYFWTRQDGDSLRLPTGDPVSFDDINSHRLRFGGRFSYAADQTVTPYIGAAWEHEFDGEAAASTYGYRINAPSLEGDTGIGEIGVTFRPSEDMPFYLDLAVQGYVGTREGATGSVQLRYDF